jgi:hypothetical protein
MFLKIIGVSTLAFALAHCGELLPAEESETSESESNMSGNDSEQSVSVTLHLDESFLGLVAPEATVTLPDGTEYRSDAQGRVMIDLKQNLFESGSIIRAVVTAGDNIIGFLFAKDVPNEASLWIDKYAATAAKIYELMPFDVRENLGKNLTSLYLAAMTDHPDLDDLADQIATGGFLPPDSENSENWYKTSNVVADRSNNGPRSRNKQFQEIFRTWSMDEVKNTYKKYPDVSNAIKHISTKDSDQDSLPDFKNIIRYFKEHPGENSETTDREKMKNFISTDSFHGDDVNWQKLQTSSATQPESGADTTDSASDTGAASEAAP